MTDFSERTKSKANSDEWFTPESAIEPIMPYLQKFKTIWCPFDYYGSEMQSNFVKVLARHNHNVVFGHIDYGKDFFEYVPDMKIDAILSNPPYSLRNKVFKRLYDLDIPFGMLMNYAGLFDNKERYNLFKTKGVQLFILNGRTNFIKRGQAEQSNSPLFQSIYICRNLLPEQIMFE